jgi:hypothetical protein
MSNGSEEAQRHVSREMIDRRSLLSKQILLIISKDTLSVVIVSRVVSQSTKTMCGIVRCSYQSLVIMQWSVLRI